MADIVRFVVELGERIDGAGGRRLYLRCAQLLMNGRGDRIRTCDPLLPKQMRYQAALLPDTRRPLGFLHFRRKRKLPVVTASARTNLERCIGVPT